MVEREIATWRAYLRSHGEVSDDNLDELESHLRDEIDVLCEKGLNREEALIIAMRRAGKASMVALEFSKGQGRVLWKQLLIDPVDPSEKRRANREIVLIVTLGLLAGLLSRIPEFFGISLLSGGEVFYLRNVSFFVVPVIGFYFFWKYPGRSVYGVVFCLVLIGSVTLANVYPTYARGHFDILIGIHTPMVLWLASALLYTGNHWKDIDRRLDFVRFSGEAFIYLVLIYCGGVVLLATASLLFSAVDVNPETVLNGYIAVVGACAAPVVAVYLAGAKRNVIENMAPVLARIFSPLFLVLMVAFIAVMAVTGNILDVGRDILIVFDVLLALVLGMLLYTISARDERKPPGVSDVINTALVISALVVDVVALIAVLSRIDTYGLSPNKAAALGENIILLINLGVSAVLYLRFLIQKEHFRSLLGWQTKYLPVIGVWAAVVAFLFPVLFRNM